MKRTPIARKTPLKRSTQPLKRSPLRKRSKRTESLYSRKGGRREFVAQFLFDNPRCQIAWENCATASVDVHEYITRGLGGSIVPGDKADRQGQKFFAVCRQCHTQLDEQPQRAKQEGFLRGLSMERDNLTLA